MNVIKKSFQHVLFFTILLTSLVSCDMNGSDEVLDDMSNAIEHPSIDEEDEKKQAPKTH